MKSKEVGEMAADAKTNGIMLDAFMMEEIVARIPLAIRAKMILPKLRPVLLLGGVELAIYFLTSLFLYH